PSSATAAAPASSSMSPCITRAPASMNVLAISHPMPRAAPVITAVRPSSIPMVCVLPSLVRAPAGPGLAAHRVRAADQPAADDQALDLAGPLVQPEESDVAVDPLDSEPALVTAASVALQGLVRTDARPTATVSHDISRA